MILLFKQTATQEQLTSAFEQLDRLGLNWKHLLGSGSNFVIVLDDVSTVPSHHFSKLPGLEKVIRVKPQYSLALKNGSAPIEVGNVTIGSAARPVVIAGPCSVEGAAHVVHVARAVKEAGAVMLRGGAYKPRTSPYDFQGLGIEGMKYLAAARQASGLPVVSEVMSPEQVEPAMEFIDMFQIGARNMYNYELLKEVGRTRLPVLLKRGMSATIQEWLSAAEYIMIEGNMQVVLCERGIRTFETHTRNTLDLSAVAALKSMTPLPVLVDPSHATGRPELIRPMARAAIACGADGLLIEVHENPCDALSDGEQAITPDALRAIVDDCNKIYDLLHAEDQIINCHPATVPTAHKV